ncbi:MAG: hypothetical protein SNJ78_10200 [Spirochaetales bacterium]
MKIVDLKDIQRKNDTLEYRKVYFARVVLQFPQETIECPVEIVFEHTPFGQVHTKVHLKQSLPYPLLPILKNISSYANQLYQKGGVF